MTESDDPRDAQVERALESEQPQERSELKDQLEREARTTERITDVGPPR
jgi:hypothetical protein